MKFWKRRRPVSIPAELIKAQEPWGPPSEVRYDFLQDVIDEMNSNLSGKPALSDKPRRLAPKDKSWLETEPIHEARTPLRDKITMTTLWD